jgi:uncharacterized repeat protein (TIGR01451 family)
MKTSVVLCAMLAAAAPAAGALTPAPGWEAFGRFAPTALKPGGEAVLTIYVYNTGAAASSEAGPTVVDTLPNGLEVVGGSCESTGSKVICHPGQIGPGAAPVAIEVPVRVNGLAPANSQGIDSVVVEGGGATQDGRANVPAVFSTSPAGIGFANFDGWISNVDGTTDTQAGSHPYEFTTVLATNSEGIGSGQESPTGGEADEVDANLPPGLVGEPSAVPECTREQFDEERCPTASQIGEDFANFGGNPEFHTGVYNLVPPAGVAAQFGATFNGTSVLFQARVRSGGNYGITENLPFFPQRKVVFNTITIWGVPGEHEAGASLRPFLTLPTSCGQPQPFSLEMLGTWQKPEASVLPTAKYLYHDSEGSPTGFTGCERLIHFQPTISLAPDTTASDSPAGLTAIVKVPQGVDPEGLATPGLKETTVVLPAGVAINPGQAAGLVACPAAAEQLPVEGGEAEAFDGPPTCPLGSKIGTDEISTPLLPDRLKGDIYILGSNPPNLEMLATASGDGVNIKLLGKAHLDETTGQLTATFNGTPRNLGTPDAPFNEFVLNFSGGAQAALVTPPLCGTYRSNAVFTPWSTPLVPDALAETSFSIDTGPGGSGPAGCTGPLPFAPTLTAGATTDQAAGYTNFTMLLQRADGQQRIKNLQFEAPKGLLGMISHVPLCKEPQAAAGTCPAASQIGHTVVGSGPGPYPLFIPEAGQPPAPIYLTEGYAGAPYGLSIVVPIVAGPFTLPTQIVRARIDVDRRTAQVIVTTDPLPTIIGGVPADLRSIYADIDRAGFMFNPSNCEPLSFSGTATSTEGRTAGLSTPFRVGSCQTLKFKPNFKVSTSGKPSRADGASLDAKIVYPTVTPGNNQASSQANIARVKVQLPKRLPSRLTTLQKACRAAVFAENPANCPAGSVVGQAKAVTPVLSGPLTGPAYFVSHGNEAFPSLIVILQGQGITVELEGTTFISHAGITTSTFKTVPDVPVTSFELALPKGPHSALAANGNLCKHKLVLPTEFVAQNGAVIKQRTPIAVTGCKKAKKKKETKKKIRAKKGARGKGRR